MLCKRTALYLDAKNKDPGHNSLSSQCRGVAPLLLRFTVGRDTLTDTSKTGVEGKPGSTGSVRCSGTPGRGCSIPRWVSGEVPSLERKTPARAGGKGWTLSMALLSSASLGVFDKLTLCTLSVGLSLSNTRSATLQLPAVTVSSLDANLGTQRGKRSTAAVVNCRGFFQLAKSIINPSHISPSYMLFWVRENHTSRHCLLLRKISIILIQKSEKEVQLCLWACT